MSKIFSLFNYFCIFFSSIQVWLSFGGFNSTLKALKYTVSFEALLAVSFISLHFTVKDPACDLNPAALCGEKSMDTYHEKQHTLVMFSHIFFVSFTKKKTNKPSHEY